MLKCRRQVPTVGRSKEGWADLGKGSVGLMLGASEGMEKIL